jgi:ribosomal protein RSM22 (predicted rRNA methylase)
VRRLRALVLDAAMKRELAAIELSLRASLRAEIDKALLEHKRHVNAELDDFNERLNGVTVRMFKALNPPGGNRA